MEIEFFGAAGEVTGSCHILRVGGRTLLVDCGLIQGGHDATRRNRLDFPFDPAHIDAVLLTHAHIDHCGRLPLLVKRGFRGTIYTNAACRDLLPLLLRDTADLAAREAERRARRADEDEPRFEPLFDLDDVERTLKLVRALRYDAEYAPYPGVSMRVRDAGHILGSSSIEVSCTEHGVTKRIVFSGDLGQYDSPILLDPYRFESADLVLMESTYGDRLHRRREDTIKEIGEIIREADQENGNILVPAFAVGRSQEILYLLGQYFDEWGLDRWKIFLDSPMAIEASKVYWAHAERFDEEARRLRETFESMPELPNLRLCKTPQQSREINSIRTRAFIIAGSGMCNGGRILHHFLQNLERPECHVMITGFQAPGTLGRQLVDRVSTVRIHGQTLHLRAKVHTVGGLSAHGDHADLLRWYDSFSGRPLVCLVHGESEPAHALQHKIDKLGGKAIVPKPGTRLDLATMTMTSGSKT
ncbi:MAG: MBL fold metallo-hydrolase [Gammaproteobacteria bacterium]|nr:MBL fold metallo-hydrolase [Gammaproteobacteria bacterium]